MKYEDVPLHVINTGIEAINGYTCDYGKVLSLSCL